MNSGSIGTSPPKIDISQLHLFEFVLVVNEQGTFEGNAERYRLKQDLEKGPVYAQAMTKGGNWLRIQITAKD